MMGHPLSGISIRWSRGTAAALVALAAVLAMPGCAWKKERDQLRTEKQQLANEKMALEKTVASTETESAEMTATLDEVQKDLEELRTKELQVIKTSFEIVQEGKSKNPRREQLRAEVQSLKAGIRENLNKLARLEKERDEARKQAAAQGKRSAALEGRVSTLERLVDELRRSLEEKEKTIAELEVQVLDLSRTVETQTTTIQEKETVIETQTQALNKAYVLIATKKVLKEKGLVEKKGSVLGLGGGYVRTGKFDPEAFREIDVTKETEFAIEAPLKKVKVLSDHPKDSYALEATGEKACALKISDPEAFWRGSRYLVVLLPD